MTIGVRVVDRRESLSATDVMVSLMFLAAIVVLMLFHVS